MEQEVIKSRTEVLHELVTVGEILLTNGAEVTRVEDTISRMGKAYGSRYVDAFVINNNIIVSMSFEEGHDMTLTRRIKKPGNTNFGKIEAINEISREYCASPMAIEELRRRIQIANKEELKKGQLFFASILGAAGFSVFFGGTALDAAVSGLVAVFIALLQLYLAPICTNKMVFNLICSFLSGLAICQIVKTFPGISLDEVMIGDIMLLVPGIAFTHAVRDLLIGDTISGLMGLTEALLWAGALACGFMSAVVLLGMGG